MANCKHLSLQPLPFGEKRDLGLSMFAYKEKVTLLSLYPKKSKFVLLLSTLHHDSSLEPDGKPEIVSYDNQTKAGVDALDQKVTHYSAYRKTNRWPMAVFYNIVDIASYNAYVLYQIRPPQASKKSICRERFKFLLEIGEKLIKPPMLQQAEYPIGLKQKTKISMQCFDVDITVAQTAVRRQPTDKPPKKKECFVYLRKSDRKIKQVCDICKRNVCSDHSEKIQSCNTCKL